MRTCPVLPEKKPLPGSQLAATVLDGCRHVVGAFEIVSEVGIAVADEPRGENFEIAMALRGSRVSCPGTPVRRTTRVVRD
jgi:hypothetical protein